MLDGLGKKDKEVESVGKIGINMMVVAFQIGREELLEEDTWEGSGIRGLKKVQGQAQWEQGSSGAARGVFYVLYPSRPQLPVPFRKPGANA